MTRDHAIARLVQAALAAAGFSPGPIDGDWEGKTEAAFQRYLSSQNRVSQDNALIRVAIGELGINETSTNQGPGIAKYWAATNYPTGHADRQPWCAAFACWCVAEAYPNLHALPKSAAVRDWVPWAQKNGYLVTQDPKPGDIVVYLPALSHIGIVETVDDAGITAIEGNTNTAGEREGIKVMRKKRALSFCGSFIRLT